jgi:integrase
MALRLHGTTYYAYFIRWERDGEVLRKRQVERSLATSDLDIARLLEQKLMEDARTASNEARATAKIDCILNGATIKKSLQVRRRLKLSDAINRAERYAPVGFTAQKLWKRFVRESGCTYMDEVTPERALSYLENRYEGGKMYNNARSALNGVFKLLLVDAGLESSPFDRVHTRRVHSANQRPFTEDEYRRILSVAPSPWKEAVQIAWHTGMREKDVFTLKWSEIHGDLIRKLPAKTARFRREVVIPIHPDLQKLLDSLPRHGERVLGAWPYRNKTKSFTTAFSGILRDAGIEPDKDTRLCFNCIRNSFITRCDAAGIPRHAIRGIVGHVSDDMTDLYSHDEISARLIQKLPTISNS